jgi:hypothetical protein
MARTMTISHAIDPTGGGWALAIGFSVRNAGLNRRDRFKEGGYDFRAGSG